MSDYARKLKVLLKDAGCYFVRQGGKGSHEIWYSPITKLNFTVVSNCKVRHTANKALEEAGLEKEF